MFKWLRDSKRKQALTDKIVARAEKKLGKKLPKFDPEFGHKYTCYFNMSTSNGYDTTTGKPVKIFPYVWLNFTIPYGLFSKITLDKFKILRNGTMN